MVINNTSDKALEIDQNSFALIDNQGRRLPASEVSMTPYCADMNDWPSAIKDGAMSYYNCGISHDDENNVWYQDCSMTDYIDFMFMAYYTKLAPEHSTELTTWMHSIDTENHILEINYAGEKSYLFLEKD